MKFKKSALAFVSTMVLAIGTASANNLVLNGDFQSFTGGYTSGGVSGIPSQLNDTGTGGYTKLDNWTVGPGSSGLLAFLMSPTTADTTGSRDIRFNNNFALHGPGNGSNNGLTGSSNGGYYVALDASSTYRGSGISQAISGMTAGHQYVVSFEWAAAQQSTYHGPTTEQLEVSLGNSHQMTSLVNNPDAGFQPWTKQSFTFTYDGVHNILNFLSLGGPDGLPPFVLLDGVSLEAAPVPEPGSMALSLLGIAGLGLAAWRRRRLASAV